MIRLLYPAVCHLCGKVVEGDEVKFCPACQKRLAGKPRQYRTDGEFFDLCLTPFAFEEPLARRLRAMKGREKPAQAAAYARLLRKKPQWTSSSTARENLPENAAALYERARYSEHPISSEDADSFVREIRNEKKG